MLTKVQFINFNLFKLFKLSTNTKHKVPSIAEFVILAAIKKFGKFFVIWFALNSIILSLPTRSSTN